MALTEFLPGDIPWVTAMTATTPRSHRVLLIAASLVLAIALAGCSGGSSMTDMMPSTSPVSGPVDMSMVTSGDGSYMGPAAGIIMIAAGMSETSGDVAFMCAAGGEDCTVTVSDDGMVTATGGMVTAMDSTAYTMRLAAAEQHGTVDTAIIAAMTAVDGLSAMSTDAEVQAAKDAVMAARDALADATELSASQMLALSERVAAVETTLASTEVDIARHRGTGQLPIAVTDVIDRALTAVEALSSMSIDQDVEAARALIATAKNAVMEAAALSDEARTALNQVISSVETALGAIETAIATHREMHQLAVGTGIARSSATPVFAASEADTVKSALVRAANGVPVLSTSMHRQWAPTSDARLNNAGIFHVQSIRSDGSSVYTVRYVLDGVEAEVSFDESTDLDSGGYCCEITVGDVTHYLWSWTSDPLSDHGEYRYMDMLAYELYAVDSETGADRDAGSFFFVFGTRTEAFPVVGSAIYRGDFRARLVDPDAPSWGDQWDMRGSVRLVANFDMSELQGRIDLIRVEAPDNTSETSWPTSAFELSDVRMNDGQFTATLTGVDSDPAAAFNASVRGFMGSVLGEFYGPNAEELGGVVAAERDEDGDSTADRMLVGGLTARGSAAPSGGASAAFLKANAIDLAANTSRQFGGEWAGGWRLISDNRHGGTYTTNSLSHGLAGAEYVWSAVPWYDEYGELQHRVFIVNHFDGIEPYEPLIHSPFTEAYRAIDTSRDRKGVTIVRAASADHGLGTPWQVTELTQDYKDAGVLQVYVATDVIEGGLARDPFAGNVNNADHGGKIELEGIPSLPADRDHLWVMLGDGESLAGSLNGVAGEFSCANADGCEFDHYLSLEAGYFVYSDGVTFTPTGGVAQPVRSPDFGAGPDPGAYPDYLAFGWWSYAPQDATQADAYDFGAYATGGSPFVNANLQGLTGTASYAGDAAGMYYVGRSSPNPTTGTFTADVAFMADFGTTDTWGTVTGEVNNFAFEGDVAAMFPPSLPLGSNPGGSRRESWGIERDERNIFDRWRPEDEYAYAGGHVLGHGWLEEGQWATYWDGKFFGNRTSASDHPNSIAGVFSAYPYLEGVIEPWDGAEKGLAGAFGAYRDDE